MQASVIIGRARSTLLDPGGANAYWTDAELLDYLNAAITATINLKPDAYVVGDFLTLVAGVVQSIPATDVQVLDVTHNASGRHVREVSRDSLNNADPNWYAAGQSAEVKHFVADARDPTRFSVYPPNDGTGRVYVLRSSAPARLTSSTSVLPLKDVYEAALHAYVVGMAYGKNTQRGDLTKQQAWMGTFVALLTGKSQQQFPMAPNLKQQERQ